MEAVVEDCDGQKMLHKLDALKNQRDLIEDGPPSRYQIKPTTDSHNKSVPYRKITFGERHTQKRHKTIFLVGETGTGKTKLINTMVNYMLGVKREDKVWFEITDESNRSSVHSQTSIITVYEFYLQESRIDLTIIDTPGYGDTHRDDPDKEIMSLLRLSESAEEISKIDAVCLVIKSTQTRLSDRQIYIFDAVQSLFGRDMSENIVLLFTHSRGAFPKNVLTAVEESKIKCAVNEENQPVYFMFDNCQSDAADKESETMQEQLWKFSFQGMAAFFKFIENIKAKSLKMTRDVLQQREQLEKEITNIQRHIQEKNEKQNKLRKTKDLEENKELVESKKNSKAEAEVPRKNKADINPPVGPAVVSCIVCQQTCDVDSWWVTPLYLCQVIKDGHCTVCTNKCHYSKHFKGVDMYKTKKNKREKEDSNNDYHDTNVNQTQEEPEDQKKVKLMIEAFHCVDKLQMIVLNTESLKTLQHIDFLIQQLKEINEPEKAETLEKIKTAGEEKNRALQYMKRCVKSENQKV